MLIAIKKSKIICLDRSQIRKEITSKGFWLYKFNGQYTDFKKKTTKEKKIDAVPIIQKPYEGVSMKWNSNYTSTILLLFLRRDVATFLTELSCLENLSM